MLITIGGLPATGKTTLSRLLAARSRAPTPRDVPIGRHSRPAVPDWQQIVDRAYEPWDRPHIVVDTAGQRPEESPASLLGHLHGDC